VLFVCAVLALVCTPSAVASSAKPPSVRASVEKPLRPASVVERTKPLDRWATEARGTIDAAVLDLALGAVSCAIKSGAVADPSTLTVIDYSRPSTEKRLWVFDLHSRTLLYEELVAHGRGSGENLATQFSNLPDSHQSSLGLFRTEDTYVGRNGYSLRLRGLDEGFNDRAYERAIVMHGAPYVDEDIARTNGRLGRSWGCPALRDGVARTVIDRVKGAGLVFAYYPDPAWLRSSKFLGDCAG
jgi:hypothetical protein